MISNKFFGKLGEKIANNYLIKSGYNIIENNFKCNFGEIDIIALKNNCIHFIEVKSRRNLNFGEPIEAINYKKLKKIKNIAFYYIFKNKKYSDFIIVFNAITIIKTKKNLNIKLIEI